MFPSEAFLFVFPWRLRRLAPAGARAARCARGCLRLAGALVPGVGPALVRCAHLGTGSLCVELTLWWLVRCASLFQFALCFPSR